MRTRFGHSLVLTYAFAPEVLAPLLPPGLALDTYTAPDGTAYGFVAVGIVSALRLRPAFLPAACGLDYVLTGYRVFARFPTPGGRVMRGLKILRSDTDRRLMVLGGNLLTRYHYRLGSIDLRVRGSRLLATVHSRDGHADLAVAADLAEAPAGIPAGSPFATAHDARRFAGPLPYTFDHEEATRSMIVVKAYRSRWQPEPVAVEVRRMTFFEYGPFAGTRPVLAQAFHVADLEYGWHRGSRRALDGAAR
ncbi:MAG: hypothetical protein AUI14_24385 [Actinobacteria bacterium 13_2_20CM_2_71_6]|nr:MAG: hypothetical protein AUI14_24385 [Actinobacteria bacterium 13_2_20CM_2_71_6]